MGGGRARTGEGSTTMQFGPCRHAHGPMLQIRTVPQPSASACGPRSHLAVLQHAQAHSVLAHAHKAAGAVNWVQHPVPPAAAAGAVARVNQVKDLLRGQVRLLQRGARAWRDGPGHKQPWHGVGAGQAPGLQVRRAEHCSRTATQHMLAWHPTQAATRPCGLPPRLTPGCSLARAELTYCVMLSSMWAPEGSRNSAASSSATKLKGWPGSERCSDHATSAWRAGEGRGHVGGGGSA